MPNVIKEKIEKKLADLRMTANSIIVMNIPGASTKVSTGHFTRAQRGRGITSLCSTDYDEIWKVADIHRNLVYPVP